MKGQKNIHVEIHRYSSIVYSMRIQSCKMMVLGSLLLAQSERLRREKHVILCIPFRMHVRVRQPQSHWISLWPAKERQAINRIWNRVQNSSEQFSFFGVQLKFQLGNRVMSPRRLSNAETNSSFVTAFAIFAMSSSILQRPQNYYTTWHNAGYAISNAVAHSNPQHFQRFSFTCQILSGVLIYGQSCHTVADLRQVRGSIPSTTRTTAQHLWLVGSHHTVEWFAECLVTNQGDDEACLGDIMIEHEPHEIQVLTSLTS